MRAVKAIFKRNLTNFVRDRVRLIATLLMSGFFLFIFSFVMKSSAISGINQPMNYLISGIIIMTVFQTALNNSIDILEDISSGFMKEILVAPISRTEISIGQILSSSAVAVLQGVIVVIVGLFMGLKLDAVNIVEMLGVMILVAITFASLGLFLATIAKRSAAFQVIISIAMLPLTFLSGALIPTIAMPKFLNVIVYINPLTYSTAIFRYIALQLGGMSSAALVKAGVAFDVGGFVITPVLGLLAIAVIGVIFFLLCVERFSKADFSNVKTFHHEHH